MLRALVLSALMLSGLNVCPTITTPTNAANSAPQAIEYVMYCRRDVNASLALRVALTTPSTTAPVISPSCRAV